MPALRTNEGKPVFHWGEGDIAMSVRVVKNFPLGHPGGVLALEKVESGEVGRVVESDSRPFAFLSFGGIAAIESVIVALEQLRDAMFYSGLFPGDSLSSGKRDGIVAACKEQLGA